jgi:hypothetical protein
MHEPECQLVNHVALVQLDSVDAYAADAHAVKSLHLQIQSPRLGLVDLDTREIKDL